MTDRYAVVGNPIAHSKSPQIHRLFAEQLNQDISYDKQLIEPGDFGPWADSFFQCGGKGLNVTLPFKTDAYSHAHRKTDRARRAGAVNTLSLEGNGTLLGDNTDGFGLLADLSEHLGWPIVGREILVLGAGGAVRGVLGPMLDAGPKKVTLANRTFDKAAVLAKAFAPFGDIEAIQMQDLKQRQFDIVVNGTSTGISGQSLDLPDSLFASGAQSYDMMYGKEPTPFLQWSASLGCDTADGLGMLVAQAAESFRIWRGKFPDFIPVIDQIRRVI